MCRCKYTDPERWGSNSDPSINGHLHYPNDVDGPLNEAAVDKIRAYRADYNNRPSNAISFMPAIASTSGRLHSEFVCLLFLKLIWILTAFLQLQEFSLRILPVDSSTSVTRRLISVLLTAQSQSGQHPRQDCSFTYQLKY